MHETITYLKSEQDPGPSLELGPELSSRDMFCLHGIALDSVGRNSILPEDTTLEERFRIAVQDRPSLSTFVHDGRATTSKAQLWSSVGVVIAGGRILAAKAGDMSSKMLEGGRRQVIEQSIDDVRSALDQIAANDAKYPDRPLDNEVVVSDPVITALYFRDTAGLAPQQINTKHVTAGHNTVPELIRELAARFGLPIFAVRTSGVYEVREFDAITGRYEFGSEATVRVRAAEVAAAAVNPGLLQ